MIAQIQKLIDEAACLKNQAGKWPDKTVFHCLHNAIIDLSAARFHAGIYNKDGMVQTESIYASPEDSIDRRLPPNVP